MAVRRTTPKQRPPLNSESLERLAVFYVGRYATTRAKLKAYLTRKVGERGWGGEGSPDLDGLIARLTALGYVDDKAFAVARATSLARRGYGARRVDQALTAAGISEGDGDEARAHSRSQAWAAALRFAERRRIGPFATCAADPQAREKALAALVRAGHPFAMARVLVHCAPGEMPGTEDTDL